MNITFNGIPRSIRKPGQYLEFNTMLKNAGLPSGERTMLLIGQKTAAGSQAVEIPVRIYSEDDAIAYFGAGSTLHMMVAAAFAANPYANITAIAAADGAQAVAAAGLVTITGPATSPGLLTVNIGNVTTECPIAKDDTAIEIATALKALLDANTSLPVVITRTDGVLTLTAKNKGLLGNSILVTAAITAPGVTAVVTAMTGGLVAPDIANCLAATQAVSFDRKVSSLNDATALGKLKTHMELICGPLGGKSGMGVYAFIGALVDALTLAVNFNTYGRMHCAFLRGGISTSWEQAAADAAVMIGESDPARPLDGLPITGIAAPAISDRLSREEQESCLAAGVTPLEVNSSGQVTIVRAITTFTTNAAGVPSAALLDTTTIDSLDYIRNAAKIEIATAFPRAKTLNPPAVEDVLYSMLKKLEAPEVQIVQNVEDNKELIVAQPDSEVVGRLNANIPAAVVPGLHVFAGSIQLIF